MDERRLPSRRGLWVGSPLSGSLGLPIHWHRSFANKRRKLVRTVNDSYRQVALLAAIDCGSTRPNKYEIGCVHGDREPHGSGGVATFYRASHGIVARIFGDK